jgi:hypothetical protein
MKITILGDMMCEPPVLKAAKQKNGEYDFAPVFKEVKNMLLKKVIIPIVTHHMDFQKKDKEKVLY